MIYVTSDWHGVDYGVVERLLQQAKFGSEDMLFVLGDVIDRGEHGIALIKHIMHKPNIKLIRGNHEEMLLSCAYLFDEGEGKGMSHFKKTRSFELWRENGADPTADALFKESPAERKKILAYLKHTPLYDRVRAGEKDYLLVHGGVDTRISRDIDMLMAEPKEAFLWTRPYLTTRYPFDFVTVLGHTPTCYYGDSYRGKILKTDTWINVDTGAAMGYTPALLCLDNGEEYYL